MKKMSVIVLFAISGVLQATQYGEIFRSKVLNESAIQNTQQETKRIRLDMTLQDALASKDFEYVEKLLASEASVDKDDEAIEQMRATVHESYKTMLDSRLKQKTLVAENSSASQVRFLDQVLGHIAYGVHSKNSAVVTASKNMAVLQSVQKYVNDLNAFFQSSERECPICFDNGYMKKKLIVCANNHWLCVTCFNNTASVACPNCRFEYALSQAKRCQHCGLEKDLEFAYCRKCKEVSTLCKTCTYLACCGREKTSAKTAISSSAITKQAQLFIKNIQSQQAEFIDKQTEMMGSEMRIFSKKIFANAKAFQARRTPIENEYEQLHDLHEQCVTGKTETFPSESQGARYLQLARQLDKMQEAAQKEIESVKREEAAIEKKHMDIIENYNNKKNSEIAAIRSMAKAATGSELTIERDQFFSRAVQDYLIALSNQ